MALIRRMSRLLTADIHAVLDRLEEPEALLRQALREMQEAFEQTEARTSALERERDASVRRARLISGAIVALVPQIDSAIDAGSEALARRLVRRKLENERLSLRLAERIAALDTAVETERRALDEQRERLALARQKAELLAAGDAAALDEHLDPDITVSEEEIDAAVARARAQRKPS